MQLVVAPDLVASAAIGRRYIDTITAVSSMFYEESTATWLQVNACSQASTHHHQRNEHHQHIPHAGSDPVASVCIGRSTSEVSAALKLAKQLGITDKQATSNVNIRGDRCCPFLY
jgi:hypothetical protein